MDALNNAVLIHKARVHPMNVLIACKTYESGFSNKGRHTWTPNHRIVDALEDTFYMAFQNCKTINKNVYLAVDVSGSMGWDTLMGVRGFSSALAAAGIALTVARRSRNSVIYGFKHRMEDLGITRNTRLVDALDRVQHVDFGGTDCAVPMIHAQREKIRVDCFITVTDCETWGGQVHPVKALKNYRQSMGLDAKMIVLATEPTRFTIADPQDAGMLDICGFDSAVPKLIEDFAAR